jgi:hypothetical protein
MVMTWGMVTMTWGLVKITILQNTWQVLSVPFGENFCSPLNNIRHLRVGFSERRKMPEHQHNQSNYFELWCRGHIPPFCEPSEAAR